MIVLMVLLKSYFSLCWRQGETACSAAGYHAMAMSGGNIVGMIMIIKRWRMVFFYSIRYNLICFRFFDFNFLLMNYELSCY